MERFLGRVTDWRRFSLIGFCSSSPIFVTACYGGGAGLVIDFVFQFGEYAIDYFKSGCSGPFEFEYDYERGISSALGGAVGTLGLNGLNPQSSLVDAVSASVISADLSVVYGCCDTVYKAIRRKKNKQKIHQSKSAQTEARINRCYKAIPI